MADKKTILYIENEPHLSSMYALRFEQAGFKVVIIDKGGEEALTAIKKGGYDLLLLDLGLPTESNPNPDNVEEGFNLLGSIKEMLPEIKRIPVIVYSNFLDNGEPKKALEMGAREFLAKAYLTPTELAEKVKSYLK